MNLADVAALLLLHPCRMTDALLGVFAQTDARGLYGHEFIQCFAALASRKLSHKVEVLFRAFSDASAGQLADSQGLTFEQLRRIVLYSFESYMTDPLWAAQSLTAPDMEAAVRHTFMVLMLLRVWI
jgi:hypothetical protein